MCSLFNCLRLSSGYPEEVSLVVCHGQEGCGRREGEPSMALCLKGNKHLEILMLDTEEQELKSREAKGGGEAVRIHMCRPQGDLWPAALPTVPKVVTNSSSSLKSDSSLVKEGASSHSLAKDQSEEGGEGRRRSDVGSDFGTDKGVSQEAETENEELKQQEDTSPPGSHRDSLMCGEEGGLMSPESESEAIKCGAGFQPWIRVETMAPISCYDCKDPMSRSAFV